MYSGSYIVSFKIFIEIFGGGMGPKASELNFRVVLDLSGKKPGFEKILVII